MRLQRPLVLRLDHLGGGLESGFDVALFGGILAFDDRCVANVLVQSVRARKRVLGGRRPLHFQCARCLDGVPLALCDDGDEFSLADDASIPDGVGIDAPDSAPCDRRPNHARVLHSRHTDVGHVIRRAEDLSSHIATWDGGAHELVLAQRLRFGLPLHVHEVADRLVPFDPRVEGLAAHQLCVGDTLR